MAVKKALLQEGEEELTPLLVVTKVGDDFRSGFDFDLALADAGGCPILSRILADAAIRDGRFMKIFAGAARLIQEVAREEQIKEPVILNYKPDTRFKN